jgi:hypothetical protein
MVSYWEMSIYYAVAVLSTGAAYWMFAMGKAAIIAAKKLPVAWPTIDVEAE